MVDERGGFKTKVKLGHLLLENILYFPERPYLSSYSRGVYKAFDLIRWHRKDGYPTFSCLILFMVRGFTSFISRSWVKIT